MQTYGETLAAAKELLAKSFEQIKVVFSNVFKFFKDNWEVIRELVEWNENEERIEISKPSYPAIRFTKGKQLKNFTLLNKPRRLCVRTNC